MGGRRNINEIMRHEGEVLPLFPKEARQNNAFALFCIGVKAILVAETRDFGFLAPNFFGSTAT
jgi:hypothetical protein